MDPASTHPIKCFRKDSTPRQVILLFGECQCSAAGRRERLLAPNGVRTPEAPAKALSVPETTAQVKLHRRTAGCDGAEKWAQCPAFRARESGHHICAVHPLWVARRLGWQLCALDRNRPQGPAQSPREMCMRPHRTRWGAGPLGAGSWENWVLSDALRPYSSVA